MLGLCCLLLALMKILCGIVVIRSVSMAAINLRLNGTNWSGFGIHFESILFEKKLKANEMLAEEVNIVEDRAIIKSVARFSTCST